MQLKINKYTIIKKFYSNYEARLCVIMIIAVDLIDEKSEQLLYRRINKKVEQSLFF